MTNVALQLRVLWRCKSRQGASQNVVALQLAALWKCGFTNHDSATDPALQLMAMAKIALQRAETILFFFIRQVQESSIPFSARERERKREREKEREIWNLFQDTSQLVWSRSSQLL